MEKLLIYVLIGVAFFIMGGFVSGCASMTANYPLRPQVSNRTMRKVDGMVIYYKETRTIPNEILLELVKKASDEGKVSVASIDPSTLVEFLDKLINAYPEVVKSHSSIRNNNGMFMTECFIGGAKTVEELEKASQVIESMKPSECIVKKP